MSPKVQPLSHDLNPQYDYFRGTVDDDPFTVLDTLQEALGMETASVTKGPKQYQYSKGIWRRRDDVDRKAPDVVVSFGGNNGSNPSVLGRGMIARELIPVMQANWPHQTKVTRVDSCVDMWDGFDVIEAEMQRIHRDSRIKRNRIGVPETGQTFYLGSDDAPTQVRLYQKGLQLLPSMAPDERFAFELWTRLEIEYHPRSADKGQTLSLSALDVWGSARWSAGLIHWVADMNPKLLDRKPRMDRTAQERFEFAMRMYAKTIKEIGADEAHRILDRVVNGELGPVTRQELQPRASGLH